MSRRLRQLVAVTACTAAAACCAYAGLAAAAAAPGASAHSCWTSTSLHNGASLEPVAGRTEPSVLVQRLLTRFGDTSFVKRIELASPPPYTFQHQWWRRNPPPSDALWAYIAAPALRESKISDNGLGARMLGTWEVELVQRALRDEFCGAGGPPLIGTTVNGQLDR